MTGAVVLHPVVGPEHDGAIAGGKHVGELEARLRRHREQPLPRGTDRRRALDARAVRRRARVLEHAVGGHHRHDAVDVVAVERVVEAVDDRHRVRRRDRHGGTVYAGRSRAGEHRTADAVIRSRVFQKRRASGVNLAFWRKWHRWIGFPGALFLLYAASTGLLIAFTEFFGEAEALREATRNLVSPVTTQSGPRAWSGPIDAAVAAVAISAGSVPSTRSRSSSKVRSRP